MAALQRSPLSFLGSGLAVVYIPEYPSQQVANFPRPAMASRGTDDVNDKEPAVLLPNGLPQPPIPQRLQELLKDYPTHLARIQEVLNNVVEDPLKLTPLFEQAIWALEDQTTAFIREAQTELEAAQEIGDADVIARAEVKEELMFSARSVNDGLGDLNEVRDYLLANKDRIG
jgi:hypothetical protein